MHPCEGLALLFFLLPLGTAVSRWFFHGSVKTFVMNHEPDVDCESSISRTPHASRTLVSAPAVDRNWCFFLAGRQYLEMEELAGFYFMSEYDKTPNRGNPQVFVLVD